MSSSSYGGGDSQSQGSFGVYSLDRNLDFNGIRSSGSGTNTNNQGGKSNEK